MGAPDAILERLQTAGRRDLGDFMGFTVGRDPRQPAMLGDGVRYEGMRFRAECALAGKPYGRPFGVDVAFGDPIVGEVETLIAEDTLAFAGIPPPSLRVHPIETHIAEKLHAYTLPRPHPNSRVKDLPDLALLASARAVDAGRLRAAIEQTFGFRGTHEPPTRLPEPPTSWAAPYAGIASDGGLPWRTLSDVYEASRKFLDPVLDAGADGTWDPGAWLWVAERRTTWP